MVNIKLKELCDKKNITRYKIQKETQWNHGRINQLYFNTAVTITRKEIDTLCDILNCEVADLIKKEDTK